MSYRGIKMILPDPRHTLGILVLACLAVLFPAPAQAFIENNVQCTRPAGAPGVQDLGAVSPGQDISFVILLDCKVLRRYPIGLNLSYTSGYTQNPVGPKFEVGSNGRRVSEGGMGSTAGVCLPATCTALPVGYRFQTVVVFKGVAGTKPGKYVFLYGLFATSLGWENYSDAVTAGVMFYTVENPACSLVSSDSANLQFGTLSSADFSAASQTAYIDLSCKSATQATVKLTPTQSVVDSAAGISATTLAGLSMASNWADTGAAVNFSTTRSLNFNAGSNTLGVRFQPRLNSPSVQPVGSFNSQYTLTITYL